MATITHHLAANVLLPKDIRNQSLKPVNIKFREMIFVDVIKLTALR